MITTLLIILLISCLVHRRNRKLLLTVTSPDRGTPSERKLVIRMLLKGIPSENIYHDLYLPKSNSGFSQIDLIVVMPQGLVCIEVKDYGGWIFGSEHQQYWTKIMNYGKEKYPFYNPLKQNLGHINTLRQQSEQFSNLPIFNIVLFDGDCELKEISYSSPRTVVGYTYHIIDILNRINELPPANYTDRHELNRILQQGVKNGEDPAIVALQQGTAKYMNSHTPAPTIKRSYFSFRRFHRFGRFHF